MRHVMAAHMTLGYEKILVAELRKFSQFETTTLGVQCLLGPQIPEGFLAMIFELHLAVAPTH